MAQKQELGGAGFRPTIVESKPVAWTSRAFLPFLSLSRRIDATNDWIGSAVAWLILIAVLISTCNAIVRKLFSISSNSWLEAQWYLFGAVFMLTVAQTLLQNAHVRVDVVFQELSKSARRWVDLAGHTLFLAPLCILMLFYGAPFAFNSLRTWEHSINPGGLIIWPAKLLVPLGFAFLFVQALSEIIKQVAAIGQGRHEREHSNGIKISIGIAFCILFFSAAFVVVTSSTGGEWLTENMAPVMFACLLLALLTGYPVAFSLGAVGLFFALIGIELDLFQHNFLQALPNRVFGVMANETLLAIPFFTLMGLLLERSGMAEDLLDTIGQLFGPVRGGLAYAVIIVGALLAATTGVVAASVISMGLISLPIMLRYNYNRMTATGVIVASGTLAQVIPPSLVLIVMADQLGRSVGDMYRAALAPGLMLVVFFVLFIFVLTIMRPSSVPALPLEFRRLKGGTRSLFVVLAIAASFGLAVYIGVPVEREDIAQVLAGSVSFFTAIAVAIANRAFGLGLLSELAERVLLVLIPPLALILLVLGTILIGLATPTEGGAMGASGTLILALARGRLTWDTLRGAVASTAQLATFVLFILIGARVFSLTFYGVNGHLWVEELLLGLPGGKFGFLVFTSLLIFALGFVLDFFEIAFILLPLLIIPAEALGIDLIWFGIIVAMTLQTSFLTPPFGFSLFFLRSVVPHVSYDDEVTGATIPGIRTLEIYRGVIPFIALQVIMIGLVITFPQIISFFTEKRVQLDDAAIEEQFNALPELKGFKPTIPNFD